MSKDDALDVVSSRPPPATASKHGPSIINSALKDLDESSAAKKTLNTKRSSRKLTRPPQGVVSQDASAPPVPAMKATKDQPTLKSSKSSGSLFSLFSKPKVEKARGYGGEGPAPQPPASSAPSPPLKSALKHAQAATASSEPPQQALPVLPVPAPKDSARAQSAQSGRSRVESQSPKPPRIEERQSDSKHSSWIAPPLFQAFARSVKHGLAEVSTSNVIDKSTPARPKTSSNKEQAAQNGISFDAKSVKSVKSAEPSEAQKIVVLLDDGHILQYTQHGPTNRLPEKVLALCQDSAAMACEGPNKQSALRIVQSVAQKSFSISSTFSRFTRRSASTKREAASLVLVFSDSSEVDDWMRAVRTKIAELCHPESILLNKETQVTSKVDSVIGETKPSVSPAGTPPPVAVSEPPVAPIKTLPTVTERRVSISLASLASPTAMSFDIDDDDSDRRNSLEMLEEEAAKLVSSPRAAQNEDSPLRQITDSPPYASSQAASDQQTLQGSRSSARMSHTSNLTSRTSSMNSEPSSQSTVEHSIDAAMKSPAYRNLSSFQPKRRSMAAPVPLQPPIDTLSSSASLLGQVSSMTELAPLRSSPPSIPPIARSSSSSSLRALTALPEVRLSKTATPPIAEEDERPQSVLTDLPPPSTWTTRTSPPKNRNSVIIQPMTERQIHRASSVPSMPRAITEQQSRRASQQFRLPLKVNPDSSARSNRNSFIADMSEPHVFTLEAKVDPRLQRMSISGSYTSEMRARSQQRLSLFPSPLLTQDSFQEDQKRAQPGAAQPASPDTVPPRRASLQRPTSLQVRNDHAPFLANVRHSPPRSETSPTSPTVAAAPIRSLKPSRSSSAMPNTQRQSYIRAASPTDPFMFAGQSIDSASISRRQSSYISKRSPSPAYAAPLMPLPVAPVVPIGNSFAQQRMMQRHSYMPRSSMMTTGTSLDFGPPMPPPNAPLPAPPNGLPPGIISRGTTPVMGMSSSRPSSTSVVGPRTTSIQANGLGIQVGS